MRWPETDGAPVCPKCGGQKSYWVSTRRQFRCANPKCRRDFTATAGTQWHSRKLNYVKIRALMTDILQNNPTARALAERHDINPKAAYYIKKRTLP